MKFVQVVIDAKTRALDTAYTYIVPKRLEGSVQIGVAVLVKFRGRFEVGFVVREDCKNRATNDYEILGVEDVLSEPYFDEKTARLMLDIAHYYVAPLSAALRLAIPPDGAPKIVHHKDGSYDTKLPVRRPKEYKFQEKEVSIFAKRYSRPENLTLEQNKALSEILKKYDSPNFGGILVDGVTGSGKTEVYLRAIEHVLEDGKNAIVLVPEIALTPQTVARFKSRFGDCVAVLHSKMTHAERRNQFWWIKRGKARVVIGPRSALFAPIDNVGIIVLDEEHETSYKQESAPRYHARYVARKMMECANGILVLGSATPSMDALYLSKHDEKWTRVELSERATGARMPKIEIVDMTQVKRNSSSQFSGKLERAILEELAQDHKVVLLLNRRGYARFLLCQDCGFVPQCPHCSTSLTFHERGNKLVCHHCGYDVVSPHVCPACNSPYLKRLGGGTQRVEAELNTLLAKNGILGDVKVIRMDADTTKTRDAHEKLLSEFADAKRAVLLGTQMIAKGLDFEEVTLVGVINADTTMHIPDFRAAERTYALIEQVSGRCGRSKYKGRVIVQTFESDNAALRAAQTHDREMFLRVEMPKRSILKYPPYVKLAHVLVWATSENLVRQEAEKIGQALSKCLQESINLGVEVSSANPCPFERIAKNYRWHILIKIPLVVDISEKLETFFRKYKTEKTVNVCVDIDPIQIL